MLASAKLNRACSICYIDWRGWEWESSARQLLAQSGIEHMREPDAGFLQLLLHDRGVLLDIARIDRHFPRGLVAGCAYHGKERRDAFTVYGLRRTKCQWIGRTSTLGDAIGIHWGYDGNEVRYAVYDLTHPGKLMALQHSQSWTGFLQT